MGLFESIFNAASSWKREEQARKAAQAAQQSADNRMQNADWNPEYEANIGPQFQREKSPVARAFLESFLTGENPAAVQSTRLGAARAQSSKQGQFNRDYGGWDALRAQQRAIEDDDERYASRAPSKVKEAEWGT